MARRIRHIVFVDSMIDTHAIFVERDISRGADLIADRRRIFTSDRDGAPGERRAARIRHIIRIEDGDVLPLDVETVRLDRAEIQDIAILWCSMERIAPPRKTTVPMLCSFVVER